MNQRFTIDGSERLEQRLDRTCERIHTGVLSVVPEKKLDLLVLGGGYGRGEGGVLKTAAGDGPYNDLEFYVFIRGNRLCAERKFGARLRTLAERLSPDAAVHVEFKVDSLDRLRNGSPTMFTYDLVSRHRVLWAAKTPFEHCEHHLEPSNIPLAEATRLLFNRCTGLLLVKELLQQSSLTSDESDFIGRNLAKAQLALGDVVLAAFGRYHWSCVRRRLRLPLLPITDQYPWWATVQRHHVAGADFKLHPVRIVKSIDEFAAEHSDISELSLQIWLWLENRRLNCTFSTIYDYAASAVRKCSGSTWRNLLLNVRAFGPSAVLDSMARRYPRERLLNSLPLLLWGGNPAANPRLRQSLQKFLRTAASDWQDFAAIYKSVWPAFG